MRNFIDYKERWLLPLLRYPKKSLNSLYILCSPRKMSRFNIQFPNVLEIFLPEKKGIFLTRLPWPSSFPLKKNKNLNILSDSVTANTRTEQKTLKSKIKSQVLYTSFWASVEDSKDWLFCYSNCFAHCPLAAPDLDCIWHLYPQMSLVIKTSFISFCKVTAEIWEDEESFPTELQITHS